MKISHIAATPRPSGWFRFPVCMATNPVRGALLVFLMGSMSASSLGAASRPDAPSTSPAATQSAPSVKPGHLVLSGIRVISTRGGRLDWGPDGRIVFDKRNPSGKRKGLYDVWIVDPDNPGKEVCITQGPGLPIGHRGNPEWHPSGKWIIFQAGIKVGNKLVTHPGSGVSNEIWAIRPDGTDPRELFNISDPKAYDGSLHPHFDHDGDRIVFSRFRAMPADFEVCILPFDAADPKREEPLAVLPTGHKQWQDGLYETHGFTPDDKYLVFTGCSDPKAKWNNDILIVDPETRELKDQVTDTPDWDEHAHIQPGTGRVLYSSARDMKSKGKLILNATAEWWVREKDGTHHRLTWFADPSWAAVRDLRGPDGKQMKLPSTKLFAADGEWSPDGTAYAGVLLCQTMKADEWIVVLEFEEATASEAGRAARGNASRAARP